MLKLLERETSVVARQRGFRISYLVLLTNKCHCSRVRFRVGSFPQTKLTMPMLVLAGEKASGNFLIEQARLVDPNAEGVVIKCSGHWLMEEATSQVIPQLVTFLTK